MKSKWGSGVPRCLILIVIVVSQLQQAKFLHASLQVLQESLLADGGFAYVYAPTSH